VEANGECGAGDAAQLELKGDEKVSLLCCVPGQDTLIAEYFGADFVKRN
jgi:hypothetical protein